MPVLYILDMTPITLKLTAALREEQKSVADGLIIVHHRYVYGRAIVQVLHRRLDFQN